MLIYFESISKILFKKKKLWYNLFNFTFVNKKFFENFVFDVCVCFVLCRFVYRTDFVGFFVIYVICGLMTCVQNK